jgi:hypothetical protein
VPNYFEFDSRSLEYGLTDRNLPGWLPDRIQLRAQAELIVYLNVFIPVAVDRVGDVVDTVVVVLRMPQ